MSSNQSIKFMDLKTNPPISVFIITKNEADRIENIINLAKEIADEILVIDSGSEDDTVKIASNAGATVIFNEWKGYGAQKIFGEEKCKNDWILNIDADEEISAKLSQEIKEIFNNNDQENLAGFKVKILNKFRFEKEPKKLAYYYNQFRLYNKNFAGFKNSTIHDSVELKPGFDKKIGQLKNIIAHQSFRSISHQIEKINSYSSMQAKHALKKGKNISYLKIFFTPFFAFFKAYIVRRYFIYGFKGIVYSCLFAFSRFAKVIKIREFFEEHQSK